MAENTLKVLVYGGTGSQGGAVVRRLLASGHQPYVLTRSPEKAEALQASGATLVTGDLADKASLREASEGMDAVALMIPAFLPNPFEAVTYARNAVKAARDAGVRLIVFNTSGPVIEGETGNPAYDLRNVIINLLKSSGVPTIIIQPTAYLENLLGPWTRPGLIEQDVLAYPVEDHLPLGWIATDDVAALIVAALERPALAGKHFVVSGVENVTGPQLAERFTQGLGRPIRYHAMPLEAFGAALDAAFGPGAGEGGIQGYKFQRENGHRMTMWVDMQPVLAELPVTMTSIDAWAAQHKAAFEAAPQTSK